jgi:glycosyltransferase involved in cell wall biosynthesis
LKDLSVCIAHRGEPMGLWLSMESCAIESKIAGVDFEFCIVTNGEKLSADVRQILAMSKRAGYLGFHKHTDDPLTPQGARQIAADNASGKYILFVDNHVLLCSNFVKRAFLDFDKYGCEILHSATRYYENDVVCYGYKLQLRTDFWGTSETVISNPYKPFKIAAAGHGGMFIKKTTFDELGGYYLSSGFAGYAGEEISHDLGAWMQNKYVWIDPQIEHRHWAASTRGYNRHYSEDFYRNLFSCAYIIANETAENYIFDMLARFKKMSKPTLKKSLYDIMIEAYERSKPYAEWLKQRRIRTLEEQLLYFQTNEIAYR